MTTGQPQLVLATELDPRLIPSFLDMNEEFGKFGEDHHRAEVDQTTFERFVEKLRSNETMETTPEGYVAGSVYWLIDGNGHMIGEVRLRHCLSEPLMEEGGHIGYNIRPTERRKGYGHLILQLVLQVARQRGLPRVRITCDTDNVASARIIERNGGILDSQGISRHSGKLVNRYWINL